MYQEYRKGAVGRGQEALLFIREPSDSASQEEDARLQVMDEAGILQIPVYKVDFDNETEVVSRYKITTAPLFLRLDAQGNEVFRANEITPENLQTLVSHSS